MLFGIKRNVLRKSDALALNTALVLIEFLIGKRAAWLDCEIKYEGMSGSGGLYQNVFLVGHISKEGQTTSTPAQAKIQLVCPGVGDPSVLEYSTHTFKVGDCEKHIVRWESPEKFSIRAASGGGDTWVHSTRR